MKKKLRICLDIDGVMGDFAAAAARLMSTERPDLVEAIGQWSKHHLTSEQRASIWKRIDAVGEAFWLDIELTPWAKRLWKECNALGETIFLTSSSAHPTSASGKLKWMQKHFGGYNCRSYLIGPRKEFCATPQTIFVDDNDHKVEPFREAGGYAILVPQPWNSNKDIIPSREEYIFTQLDSYAKRINHCIDEGDERDKRIAYLEREITRLRDQIGDMELEVMFDEIRRQE